MADTPRFLNICAPSRGFNIFKQGAWGKPHAYPGMVVASSDSIYFAVDESRIISAVSHIGGAVGGAIGGLMAGKRKKNRKAYLPQPAPHVEETDLAELSGKITEHPDWPVTWQEGPVIVAARAGVKALRTSFWLGGIEVTLEGVIVNVFTPVFQRKKLAAMLVEMGWEVEGV